MNYWEKYTDGILVAKITPYEGIDMSTISSFEDPEDARHFLTVKREMDPEGNLYEMIPVTHYPKSTEK
jgi:hypothetical protein